MEGERIRIGELPEEPAVEAPAPEAAAPEAAEAAEAAADEIGELARLAARLAAEKAAQWAGARGADPSEELARSLARQEEEIRREDADFDLGALLHASPAFRALVLAGEPVERALSYVDPERGLQKAEEEVIRRIRRRGGRPRSMGNESHPEEKEEMDEAALRRIDERLKRGEKVYI